jgi:hypothetical protein
VGAGVSLALHARTLGFVLIALAVLAALAGVAVALARYSRFKTGQAALMRDALAEQQRRTGRTAPDKRE